MAGGKLSPKEERELFELKQRAMAFYEENGVPQRMEEILNSMFYDAPNDVYGHLANYFETFALVPTINKLKCREALDSRGQSTFQTDVYCTVKNNVKLTSSFVSSNESYPHDGVKAEEKEIVEEERKKSIKAAVNLISGEISLALWGLDPKKQSEVDAAVENVINKLQQEEEDKIPKAEEDAQSNASPRHATPVSDAPSKGKGKGSDPKNKKGKESVAAIPDEPREKFFCGCNAISAVSQAVCLSAAITNQMPLFKHIASLKCDQMPEKFKMPLPMVTILGSGRSALGKLNCIKEFMIVPKIGTPPSQSLPQIADIYNYCAKAICTKAAAVAKYVNDVGALCPSYDRPEQGLDLLQDAMTSLGLTPGEHFNIALNCAGHEIFDFDKAKYEIVAGQQKSADDLVDFWTELLGRYPSVNVLIDPMRKADSEAWMRLCGSLSEKCLILGNAVYHRPGLLKDEEIVPTFKSSGIILQMENMNTVTDVITVAKKFEDSDFHVAIGTSYGDVPGPFLADLAVGLQASFLKLGAPCRGERVGKLNHLAQIESILQDEGLLNSDEGTALAYPLVRPPTPPPEEEEEREASPTAKPKK